MRVIVVHGIHTNDTEGWMDYMVSRFTKEGYESFKWTYGYAYALLARFQNPSRARKLAAIIQHGDVIVGHSNGCTLAYMAHRLGAPMQGAILLNPALDTATVFNIPWVNLYPNTTDDVVAWGGILRAHPWGAQGKYGLSKFVDAPHYLTRFTDFDEPRATGHSGILKPDVLPAWTTRIIHDLQLREQVANQDQGRR